MVNVHLFSLLYILTVFGTICTCTCMVSSVILRHIFIIVNIVMYLEACCLPFFRSLTGYWQNVLYHYSPSLLLIDSCWLVYRLVVLFFQSSRAKCGNLV